MKKREEMDSVQEVRKIQGKNRKVKKEKSGGEKKLKGYMGKIMEKVNVRKYIGRQA